MEASRRINLRRMRVEACLNMCITENSARSGFWIMDYGVCDISTIMTADIMKVRIKSHKSRSHHDLFNDDYTLFNKNPVSTTFSSQHTMSIPTNFDTTRPEHLTSIHPSTRIPH